MRPIVAAAIAAVAPAVLSIGGMASPAAALDLTYKDTPLVHRTVFACSFSGCAQAQPVQYGWGRPWGSPYRPACPENYYFACRPDLYGREQCACWPYRW